MNKMLVISAHGADWCTRAGGIILKYITLGWEVTVFALTYGEHGESGNYWKDHPGCTVDEVKSCRESEAKAAADYMGVKEIRFFDYGDYPLFMDEYRIRRLTADILALRPDVILTHWKTDKINPDHAVCAEAVLRAVTAAGMRGPFRIQIPISSRIYFSLRPPSRTRSLMILRLIPLWISPM